MTEPAPPQVRQPFLKWPGGKRWTAARVADLVRPKLKGRYFEPFLGGGAVFFQLCHPNAVLSDINDDLIATYVAIRDKVRAVRRELKTLPVDRETYYALRAMQPRSAVKRAARFLYLNRTAFGGIYRLNGEGKFNVPYGGGSRTHQTLWETNVLLEASQALGGVQLSHGDFEQFIRQSGNGDVVYCDPTYTVAHENNGFIRYNERNFSWDDQKRLAGAALAARERGASVIVSNAYHRSVLELYPRAEVRILTRRSLVSPKISGRRLVKEALIIV